MGFARFMATGISRSIRMVTGVALIAFGPLRVPFKGSDVRVPADGPDDTPVDISVQ